MKQVVINEDWYCQLAEERLEQQQISELLKQNEKGIEHPRIRKECPVCRVEYYSETDICNVCEFEMCGVE